MAPHPPPGPQATFSCAAHLGSPSLHRAAASQRPTPTWQGPSQSLQNQSHQQPNSPPHLFHTSPDLIRFSSFLPVLGQSLLKTVENSFAPAVRKRLSPVRKIIKPSSHIRGNESPFLIGFAGRLFSSVLGKEVQTKSEQLPSGSCPPPPPFISLQRPRFLLSGALFRASTRLQVGATDSPASALSGGHYVGNVEGVT